MKRLVLPLIILLGLCGSILAADITPEWTENVELHASASLAAAATATDDIDLDNLDYHAVLVTIQIAFGGTPNNNCQVDVFLSSDSGTNDDTISTLSFTIAQSTSTTKRISFLMERVPYMAVAVKNNDSSSAVTYKAWYAGLKYQSN